MGLIDRGDVFDAELPGLGVRPVVVVTRQAIISVLTSVTVAHVTSTIRGIPTEVEVGASDGLEYDCVVNCDNLNTIPKRRLNGRRGRLGPDRILALDQALALSLGLG